MPYITKQKLEQIKKELEELEKQGRQEVAKHLKKAKDFGDLSENFEYSQAKEEQAFLEQRISRLRAIITKAVVIKKPSRKDVVEIGCRIKVRSGKKEFFFTLVGSEESSPENGFLSNESPLGRVFLNKKVKDLVKINTPKGTIVYKIISIC